MQKKNEANTTLSHQEYLKVVKLRNQVSDEQANSIFCYESIADLFYSYFMMIWNKYYIIKLYDFFPSHNYVLQENKYDYFKELILQSLEKKQHFEKFITVDSPESDRTFSCRRLWELGLPHLCLSNYGYNFSLHLVMRLSYTCIYCSFLFLLLLF